MRSLLCVVVLLGINEISATQNSMSPVTRVVELLKGLAAKVEEEGKVEEDLYEKYVCWGKSSIDAYSAYIEENNAKIAELEQYISDIEAGRIEFTSERVDLQKKMAELKAAHEEATSIRDQENEDYKKAKAEFDSAIDALKEAIKVLDDATKEHKGSLLSLGNGEGYQSRLAEGAVLNKAVEIGHRFLAKGDAVFLERLLTGEVPAPKDKDWKKLNRKATFKKAYKARSVKIQDLLAKLLENFSQGLKDATAKEDKASDDFDELIKANEGSQKETKQALVDMDAENGARGQTKEEAQEEVDTRKQENTDNEKFITQVKKSLAAKKKEWGFRQEARTKELTAMAEAIKILYNDDARDNFKQSFKSQGYLFVQDNDATDKMLKLIKNSSGKTEELLSLARGIRLTPKEEAIDKVIVAIDDMLKELKGQQKEDLKTKEDCEENLQEESRKAVVAARLMDDETDKVTEAVAAIAKLRKEIAEAEEEIKKTEKDLADAKKQREEENAAWKETDAQDKLASETVAKAAKVLETMMTELNAPELLQQPNINSGKAPPPPPATWEAPYSGKKDENRGIVEILKMIKEDIDADQLKAKTEEDDAQTEYEELKEKLEQKVTDLKKLIKEKKTQETEQIEAKTAAKTERATQFESYNAATKAYEDMWNPDCEYIALSFPVRVKNRAMEIEGLIRAKGILKGGQFEGGDADFDQDDENRAIKPGDAFLERRF